MTLFKVERLLSSLSLSLSLCHYLNLFHTVPASLSLSSLQFNLQLIVAQLQRQRSCAHCKFINEATHMSSDVGSNSDADSDALLSVVWVTDVSCGRAKSFHRAFVEL